MPSQGVLPSQHLNMFTNLEDLQIPSFSLPGGPLTETLLIK